MSISPPPTVPPGSAARAGVTIRRATAADSEARCELFARVTMDADLSLAVDRGPDFDALYRLQTGDYACWVGEEAGLLRGMGTVLARDGYVDGQPAKVGYLGDLRIEPGYQGLGLLPRFYERTLADAVAATGARVFLTVVIASNRQAIAALTGPKAAARGIPPYTLLRRFSIRAVHATVPRRTRRTGYTVRRATAADLPAVEAFLDTDGRSRPYGYRFQAGELTRRLAAWPGLDVSRFLLAFDRGGDLAGCTAVWDASGVKRTVVRAYRGRMRAVRAAYNTAGAMLRFPRLPAAGGVLRYAYLTHVAVPSRDPAVMAALLDVAYAEERRSGRVFLSACVWDDDPLAAAYRGFVTTDLPTNLYAVTLPGDPLPRVRGDDPPGFEMALV